MTEKWDMFEHIKEYTRRNWVVHPLSSPTDSGNSPGKKPLMVGWQNLKHTPMIHHFPPGCNIGLVCGRVSDVMVIDYDNALFSSSEPTGALVSYRTVGRGHKYYRYDPRLKSQKHHLLGIEVLSDGSNAVLPPSVHVSGEVYRWLDERSTLSEMADAEYNRLIGLLECETELKQMVSKCRYCFKRVLRDYPDNVPEVKGSDGRLFMLAICTDLTAMGAKEEHIKMFSKLMYRNNYDEKRTFEEWRGISSGMTWRCNTLREKLPAYVKCSECANTKFNRPENGKNERMRLTIPASVKELTLVIEK